MKKVLMTYMESGMGHITSITSISDNFKKLYGNEFEIDDCYIMQEDKDKNLLKYEKFIINQTKNTLKFKGFGDFIFIIFEMFGAGKFTKFTHKTLFRKALLSAIEAYKRRNPDVIVSTHYFLSLAALEYKKKYNNNVKVITYNPDNNINPVWVNDAEQLYLVNNEHALNEAIKRRKFNKDRIKLVGFSARNAIINCNESKEFYRDKYNIAKDKFCVLVADGVYATRKCKRMVKKLAKSDKEMTIIALAGKTDKIYEYFCNLKPKSNINLIPLKFTTDIHEYYRAADLFITKAGPNAILDSVFVGTPIIVDYYGHPIEKATTKLFINEYGVGKAIFKRRKIKKQVEQWVDNPSLLKPYADNTAKIDKFGSGGEIAAKYIYEEINS